MPLPLLALGLAAAPSIVKGLGGLIGIGKANRAAKRNIRPTYEIPKEFQQNVAIADNMARVGMPQQQYNNAINNIGRNQAGAIRQLGRSANPGAGLASMLRSSNDATMNLDAQDANARMNNQRFAFGQRGMMGQQRLAKQNWDKFGNYQEKAATIAQQLGSGKQNAFGALNDLSQLGQIGMMTGQFGGKQSVAPTTPGLNYSSWMNSNAMSNLPGNNLSQFGQANPYKGWNAPFKLPF